MMDNIPSTPLVDSHIAPAPTSGMERPGGLDRPDPGREAERDRLAQLLGALLADHWLRRRAETLIDKSELPGEPC